MFSFLTGANPSYSEPQDDDDDDDGQEKSNLTVAQMPGDDNQKFLRN